MRNLYEGCSIRGLPINVPFKYTFNIPRSKRSHFYRKTEGIFIILSYKAFSLNKYADIVPAHQIQKDVRLSRGKGKQNVKSLGVASQKPTGDVYSPQAVEKVTVEGNISQSNRGYDDEKQSECTVNKPQGEGNANKVNTVESIAVQKVGDFDKLPTTTSSGIGICRSAGQTSDKNVNTFTSINQCASTNKNNAEVENIIITQALDENSEDANEEKVVENIQVYISEYSGNNEASFADVSLKLDNTYDANCNQEVFPGEIFAKDWSYDLLRQLEPNRKDKTKSKTVCSKYGNSNSNQGETDTEIGDSSSTADQNEEEGVEQSETDDNEKSKPKRKFEVEFEAPPKKVKVIEEDTDAGDRRKSTRLRSVGFRPDYHAMEKDYKFVDSSATESDDDNSDVNEDPTEENPDPNYEPDEFMIGLGTEEDSESSETDSNVESESDLSEGDLDVVGKESADKESRIEKKLRGKIKRFKKLKARAEKLSKRIKVSLVDHPDKYRKDTISSHARKDRGKSKEEVTVEVMVCTLCNKFRSNNDEEMEDHLGLHLNKDLDCCKCDFVGATIHELRIHKRKQHKVNLLICYVCGEEFFTKTTYRQHLGLKHDDPQYDCEFCSTNDDEYKKFATINLLRQHCLDLHPGTAVQCPTCKRLMSCQAALENHLTICKIDQKVACEICGKTFASQSIVQRHRAMVHSNTRTHKCNLCTFTCFLSGRLKNHMLVHEGHHPYRCEECDFSCVQQYQLTSHMRTHTGDKPYKCEKCNYAAAWKVQLKDHFKAHESKEAVTCEKCGILFKSAKTLALHSKKEHS